MKARDTQPKRRGKKFSGCTLGKGYFLLNDDQIFVLSCLEVQATIISLALESVFRGQSVRSERKSRLKKLKFAKYYYDTPGAKIECDVREINVIMPVWFLFAPCDSCSRLVVPVRACVIPVRALWFLFAPCDSCSRLVIPVRALVIPVRVLWFLSVCCDFLFVPVLFPVNVSMPVWFALTDTVWPFVWLATFDHPMD